MDWLEELISNKVEATHDCEDECNCNFYIDSKSVEEVTAIIRAELRKRMPKVKTYSDRDVYDKGLTGMAKDEGYNEALADVMKAFGLEDK